MPYFVIDGQLYFYSNGLYVCDKKDSIARNVIQALMYPNERKEKDIKETLEKLRDKNAIELPAIMTMQRDYKNLVNFKNGVLNIQTGEFAEHTPEQFFINQIPMEYNKGYEAPAEAKAVIDDFLSHIAPDPADLKMLLIQLGICLSANNDRQKMLVITGASGCGKSTLLNLFTSVLGEKNRGDNSLDAICNDKFAAYSIIDKLVNICDDIDKQTIDNPARIKQITGDDGIQVERKFGDKFAVKLYTRFTITANELPPIKDENGAFFRRILMLNVPSAPSKRDDTLLDKLLTGKEYFLHLIVNARMEWEQNGRPELDSQNSILLMQ